MMNNRYQPCSSGRFWRINQGDTLYSIALRTKTTIANLLTLNPDIVPENLQIGSLVCLPPEVPPCVSGIFWRVAAGDTLYQIATTTKITVPKLLELNPGIDPNNLQIGQSLCLPD